MTYRLWRRRRRLGHWEPTMITGSTLEVAYHLCESVYPRWHETYEFEVRHERRPLGTDAEAAGVPPGERQSARRPLTRWPARRG
jgi:hypothetical protein